MFVLIMTEVHQKIVNEIVKEYKKDKSTLAVTLFGSLARGEERPDSDVDIEIISENAIKWELLKKKKYNIDIDLVITPRQHLIHQMEKYPYLCYDYLSEKIVYDPNGLMEEVKIKLKEYFDKHPEIVEFWEEKLKIMKKNKAKGQDPKDAMKSYDEAEILFSKEHKVTRDFFKEDETSTNE
jgi:predicted nucleotidyltransferase